MDIKKIDICKNNCKIYNCLDKIEIIHGDMLNMNDYIKEKLDVVFLSPPWSGPE